MLTSWLKKTCLGIVLALLLLEGGLRVGSFALAVLREYKDLQAIRRRGDYRILCLGESTTQQQFPQPLERILNQAGLGIHFTVIDKGRATTNSPDILRAVELYLADYHPDMVVAMMGINDNKIRYYQSIPENGSWIFRHCRIYRFFRILIMQLSQSLQRNGSNLSQGATGIQIRHLASDPSHPPMFLPGTLSQRTKLSEELNKPLKTSPTSKNAPSREEAQEYLVSGRIFRAQDKSAQAEEQFKKAIAVDPQNDVPYLELGISLLNRGETSLAHDLFMQCVRLNPENDQAYVGLGWIYRDQNDLSGAERAFRKALQIDPKNSGASFDLGALYQLQGNLDEAERLLKQTVRIDPKNDRAWGALASLSNTLGNTQAAQECSAKANALRMENNSPVTVDSYRRLKSLLDKSGTTLVCVQYPMRSLAPLKRIFDHAQGILWVDNEAVFKDAVHKDGYAAYFRDMFAGDFGHCTPKGNELLARNIAAVILREVFKLDRPIHPGEGAQQ